MDVDLFMNRGVGAQGQQERAPFLMSFGQHIVGIR